MNGLQNVALGNLLAAWRPRDDARHTSNVRDTNNVRRLADARFELDGARNEMRSTLGALR